MFGYAVRPCGIEQLFVFFQAAGIAMLENGVQERLPSYPDPPDPEQLLPRSPNQALGSGPSFSVKRTIVRFREAAEGPQAEKRTIITSFGGCRSGHWVRLYRTIIRFPDPGRSGPEQKKPRAVKLGV